ncbi:hypothetical protein ABC977_17025 [Thioalkalicoccus limnaeus]|uniref:Baseplate protein J-like domain-containing protein n=1 Tax=Thioalkalicoccus limnaeus TaxID=120681 RepID=A0ABV4BK03_9GAMM
MSEPGTLPFTPADDGFERHYTEKIWALVPEVYRDEDFRAAVPGQLRAFVELLAVEAAIARRSVDRLWADSRADEADDWAIAYLGALVGARPVSALNRAGQRANLARTILYRRRQGTAPLAERLADDIADWDGVAREGFLRLFRLWHQLDGGPLPGPITRSPRWGYPDLRNARIGEILDGAHDDLAHRPDVRRQRGAVGRYGIAKLNLHLFRVYAYPIGGVTPHRVRGDLFTVDPSGRDVPLFQVGGRDIDDCIAARDWQMRAPLTCRRLQAGAFEPIRDQVPAAVADLLTPIYGRRFETEAELLEAANAALVEDAAPPTSLTDDQAAQLIAASLIVDCPRRNLLPGGDGDSLSVELRLGAAAAGPLGPERLYAANLAAWGETHDLAGWIEARVDPTRGRVRLTTPLAAGETLLVEAAYYGIFHPVGAGTHERTTGLAATGFTTVVGDTPDWTGPLSGDLRILDSRTLRPQVPADGLIDVDADLTLGAGDDARPYVVLAPSAADEVTLRATTVDLTLVVDGLWLAVEGPGAGDTALVLEGDWARVILRNVTLDPGGERVAAPGDAPAAIPAVTLALAGTIGELILESCVTGPLVERTSALRPCSTDVVILRDSLVQSRTVDPAIDLVNGRLSVDRTTVMGGVIADRLDASHLLVDGVVGIEDRQNGCFRFSAAAEGSVVAYPYESTFFAGGLPPATFVSTRFGDPGFGQLAPTAAAEIATGGEQGTEIGVFHRALDPIERQDLAAKLAEFMPINVIAQQVFET